MSIYKEIVQQSVINTSTSKQMFSFGHEKRFSHSMRSSLDKFYELPTTKTMRSTGFGYGKKYDCGAHGRKKNTPAPNTYNLRSSFQGEMSKTFGSSREAVKNNSILQFASKYPGPGTYPSRSTLSDIKYSMRPQTNNGFLSRLNKVAPGPGTYEKLDSISKTGKFPTSKFRTYGVTIINPDHGNKSKGNRKPRPWTWHLQPQERPAQQGAHQTQHLQRILLLQEYPFQRPEETIRDHRPWAWHLPSQERVRLLRKDHQTTEGGPVTYIPLLSETLQRGLHLFHPLDVLLEDLLVVALLLILLHLYLALLELHPQLTLQARQSPHHRVLPPRLSHLLPLGLTLPDQGLHLARLPLQQLARLLQSDGRVQTQHLFELSHLLGLLEQGLHLGLGCLCLPQGGLVQLGFGHQDSHRGRHGLSEEGREVFMAGKGRVARLLAKEGQEGLLAGGEQREQSQEGQHLRSVSLGLDQQTVQGLCQGETVLGPSLEEQTQSLQVEEVGIEGEAVGETAQVGGLDVLHLMLTLLVESLVEQHSGAADGGHHPHEGIVPLHVFLEVLHDVLYVPEFVLVGDRGGKCFFGGGVKGGYVARVVQEVIGVSLEEISHPLVREGELRVHGDLLEHLDVGHPHLLPEFVVHGEAVAEHVAVGEFVVEELHVEVNVAVEGLFDLGREGEFLLLGAQEGRQGSVGSFVDTLQIGRALGLLQALQQLSAQFQALLFGRHSCQLHRRLRFEGKFALFDFAAHQIDTYNLLTPDTDFHSSFSLFCRASSFFCLFFMWSGTPEMFSLLRGNFFRRAFSFCLGAAKEKTQEGTRQPETLRRLAMGRRRGLSSSLKKVRALPGRPPLPVLPTRCTQVIMSFGKSQLITSSTPLKSMPLANRSVQIRAQVFWHRKSDMMRSLSQESFSLNMLSIGMFLLQICTWSSFALSLLCMKISTGGTNWPQLISYSIYNNLPASVPVQTSFCSTVASTLFLPPTCIRTKSAEMLDTSYSTPCWIVAEKKQYWTDWLVCTFLSICFIWLASPSSKNLSASSRTRWPTLSRTSPAYLTSFKNFRGVVTRMSMVQKEFLNTARLLLTLDTSLTLSPALLPFLLSINSSRQTYQASSTVGTTTNAYLSPLLRNSLCTSPSPQATVLPEPVGAVANTLLPFSTWSMAAI